MTIDEAIKHCLEVVENNEQFASGKWIGSEGEANRQECLQCAADHRQLAEWLKELKEAKRLLRIALDDFKEILPEATTCECCKWCSKETGECAYCHDDVPCEQKCGWIYEAEALKLIGNDKI